jgi:hypothetical protein
MDLKDIVAITGMGGLFRLETQRNNGIIVSPLPEGAKKFVSARQHLFTPLENITIFTEDEGMELKEVFIRMKAKAGEIALPDVKASNDDLHAYFAEVVPEYDADRVYASDIKKMVRWFEILDNLGMVTAEEESAEEPAKEGGEEEE